MLSSQLRSVSCVLAEMKRQSLRFGLWFLFLASAWGAVPHSSNADAGLDLGFGDSGIASSMSGGPDAARGIVEGPAGRIVAVGGYSKDGSSCSGIYATRFLPSGEVDDTFGFGGRVRGPTLCETAEEVAVGAKGGLYLGGWKICRSDLLLSCQVVAQRLGANGLPAKSWAFGSGVGRRFVFNGNPGPGASGLATNDIDLDARGRILLAGTSIHGRKRSGGFILRLKPDGELDRSLVGSRRSSSRIHGMIEMLPPEHQHGSFSTLKSLGNGRILAAGTRNGRIWAFQALNSGRADPEFAIGGAFSVDLDGTRCKCTFGSTMARDYHRRILIAGGAYRASSPGSVRTLSPVLVRLKASGRLDESFGSGGVKRPDVPGFLANSVAIDRRGRIVMVGRIDQDPAMVRLLPDGNLDRDFFEDGVVDVPGSSAEDVLIDTSGRIVIGGRYKFGGMQVVRYLSD